MTNEEIKHIIDTMRPMCNVFSCTGGRVTAYLPCGSQITFNSLQEVKNWGYRKEIKHGYLRKNAGT